MKGKADVDAAAGAAAPSLVPLGVMTPRHPRWQEFYDRLEGPEGCNFRREISGKRRGEVAWDCDARDVTLPKTRAILRAMGASETEVVASVLFYNAHGGYCDCEVIFNVNPKRNPKRKRKPATARPAPEAVSKPEVSEAKP